MAKSSKPLSFLVHPEMYDWPEFQKLREQGHRVDVLEAGNEYDLILGPTCWRMDERLRKHLLVAIKESRKLRYGGKT